MTDYVNMFRGQVKVSDVKAAFDKAVGDINNIVDGFNTQAGVSDIDYTQGSSSLAPNGYTLTVGGMKQFMQAADGCVIGCKPFRVDDMKFKLTASALITKDKIYSIPDSLIANPDDAAHSTLYFNPQTEDFQWGNKYNATVTEETDVTFGCRYRLLNSELNGYGLVDDNAEDISLYLENDTVGYAYYRDFGMTINKNGLDATKLTETSFPVNIDYLPHILLDKNMNTNKFNISTTNIPKLANDQDFLNGGFIFGNINGNSIFTPKVIVTIAYTGQTNEAALTVRGITSTFKYKDFSQNNNFKLVTYRDYEVRDSELILKNIPSNISKLIFDNGVVSYENSNGELISGAIDANMFVNKDINCILFCTREKAQGISEDFINDYYIPANYKLDIDGDKTYYLDVVPKTVRLVTEVTQVKDAYRLCTVNTNTPSKFLGFSPVGIQSEAVNGTFKIMTETKNYSGRFFKENSYRDVSTYYEALDTSSSPKFVGFLGSDTDSESSGVHNKGYLFGEEVDATAQDGHRRNRVWSPINFLYVPKGAPNPYTYSVRNGESTDIKYSSQKVFNVIIEKNIKD